MTRSLRILKITGAYPPAYAHGGTATAAHSLCKSLLELGHSVCVLTTDINSGERLPVPRGWTLWENVRVRYCRWIRCPIPYFSWELVHELRRKLAQCHIVLLDSAWTGYGVLTGRECKRAGVPYVVYAHGCHAPQRLHKSRLKKRLWWSAFDKALYNGAAAAIALTQAEIGYLRAMGVTTRIEPIPNGVELEPLDNADPRRALEREFPEFRGRKIVLFLGRLEPIKGVDLLIRAFAKVRKKFPKTILVIGGPSERGYDRIVRRTVEQCDLARDAVLTGLVTGMTKASLLRSAEAFVLPSYGEGLPMAALEAMACGVPVVLSRDCNLPEVEEVEAGILTETTVDSIALGLCQVLADHELGRQMGERGKKLVAERFTWETVARKTTSLCKHLLQGT